MTTAHMDQSDSFLPHAKVMGILNITPDSFYDGGWYYQKNLAVQKAIEMVEDGADWIDIGGESTRPGAKPISEEEEADRVLPIIEAVKSVIDIPISIDTSKGTIMREAIKLGVLMINDVYALQQPGALEEVVPHPVKICLMHMQGNPRNMQKNPIYSDVIDDIKTWLNKRILVCEKSGISRDRLYIDPGFGFGKTVEDNLSLIRNLEVLKELNLPILIGVSRKSTIGKILNLEPQDRLIGSLVLNVIAVLKGVNLIRTHDVKEAVEALKMIEAVWAK